MVVNRVGDVLQWSAGVLTGAVLDIRTAQELMGHADVKTTMIYTHVFGLGASGVRSPLDTLTVSEDDSPSRADG